MNAYMVTVMFMNRDAVFSNEYNYKNQDYAIEAKNEEEAESLAIRKASHDYQFPEEFWKFKILEVMLVRLNVEEFG